MCCACDYSHSHSLYQRDLAPGYTSPKHWGCPCLQELLPPILSTTRGYTGMKKPSTFMMTLIN